MSNTATKIVLGMMTALLLIPVVSAGTPNVPPDPEPCRFVPPVYVPDAIASAVDLATGNYRELSDLTDDYSTLREACNANI